MSRKMTGSVIILAGLLVGQAILATQGRFHFLLFYIAPHGKQPQIIAQKKTKMPGKMNGTRVLANKKMMAVLFILVMLIIPIMVMKMEVFLTGAQLITKQIQMMQMMTMMNFTLGMMESQLSRRNDNSTFENSNLQKINLQIVMRKQL